MKRYIIYLSFIALFAVLSGCSAKSGLELVGVNIDIGNDKATTGSTIITEGDNKGLELVPTALYYEFTIKNASHKSIGGLEENKALDVKIVPSVSLATVSNEIIGFNIFEPSAYIGTGLGYGESIPPIIGVGKEEKYVLYFCLGVSEKDPQVPVLTPPAEKLKELEDAACDATLIVMSGENEIVRFDLNREQ